MTLLTESEKSDLAGVVMHNEHHFIYSSWLRANGTPECESCLMGRQEDLRAILDTALKERADTLNRVKERDELVRHRSKDLYVQMEIGGSQRYTLRRGDGLGGNIYPRKDRQLGGVLLGKMMVSGGSDQFGGLRDNVERSIFLGEDGGVYYTDRRLTKAKISVSGMSQPDKYTLGIMLEKLVEFGLSEGI